jgi:hypothetical protein
MNIKTLKFMPIWAMALAIGFASCNSDDDDPINVDEVIEDGYYIVGEATALSTLDLKGRMVNGINENNGADQTPDFAGLYEKYIALEADKPFSIIKKAGSAEATFGATTTVTEENGADYHIGTAENPVSVQTGDLTANGATLKVPTSGLYQVVVYDDATSAKILIIPVEWQLNGISTQGGDYKLTPGTFSKTSMTYSLTNVTTDMGNFKIKNHDGWKVGVVPDAVWVNSNFGLTKDGTFKFDGSDNAVLPGGSDIPVTLADRGIYTVTLTWTLGNNWSHTLKFSKTGDLEAIDPATFVYSLIGSAFKNADGTTASWDYDADLAYDASTSTASLSNYQIAKITLIGGGEFKVRKDHDWAVGYGYEADKIKGDVANFEENGGNIKVKTSKVYNVIFSYDWNKTDWSLTLTALPDEVEEEEEVEIDVDPATLVYSLIGNAFNNDTGGQADWSYDIDLAYDEGTSTSSFSNYKAANVALIGDGAFKVRKDHDWTVSYGYDADKITGDGANFEGVDGNIKVKTSKTYTSIVFSYNWDENDWSLTLTE